MELNMDDTRRRELLGLEPGKGYPGGITHFRGLTGETLQKLIDEGFADPDDQQNCAPAIWQINDFLQDNPDFTAHGYAVGPERWDYRISIEGVEGKVDPGSDIFMAFIEMFRGADEFSCENGECYAWYD